MRAPTFLLAASLAVLGCARDGGAPAPATPQGGDPVPAALDPGLLPPPLAATEPPAELLREASAGALEAELFPPS